MEAPRDLPDALERLARKFETMRQFVPAPVVSINPKAKIGYIASGTSDFAVRESIEQLRDEGLLDEEIKRAFEAELLHSAELVRKR